jgi:hypothetical protein
MFLYRDHELVFVLCLNGVCSLVISVLSFICEDARLVCSSYYVYILLEFVLSHHASFGKFELGI